MILYIFHVYVLVFLRVFFLSHSLVLNVFSVRFQNHFSIFLCIHSFALFIVRFIYVYSFMLFVVSHILYTVTFGLSAKSNNTSQNARSKEKYYQIYPISFISNSFSVICYIYIYFFSLSFSISMNSSTFSYSLFHYNISIS